MNKVTLVEIFSDLFKIANLFFYTSIFFRIFVNNFKLNEKTKEGIKGLLYFFAKAGLLILGFVISFVFFVLNIGMDELLYALFNGYGSSLIFQIILFIIFLFYNHTSNKRKKHLLNSKTQINENTTKIDADNNKKNDSSNQPLEKATEKEIKHVDEINRQLDEIERQIADFRKTINTHSKNVDVTTDDDDITEDIFENIEFDNTSDDKATDDSISQNILRLINENIDDIDPMFEDIVDVIIENRFASTSLLQRKLQISYARAGRIIDFLEKVNIISFSNSKFREVLISREQWINNIKLYLPKIEINYKPTAINNDSTISYPYTQQIISNSSDKSEYNSFDEWFNEIISKAPYSYVVVNGKTELSKKGKIYNDPLLKKAAKAVYEGKDISNVYIQYYFKTSEKKANQIMNTLKDLKILK